MFDANTTPHIIIIQNITFYLYVRSIGPSLLFNPDIPGLAESSPNTVSFFTFVLDFDPLTHSGLCFLALGVTLTLVLVFDCCLAFLLLAWDGSVSMIGVFIRLPLSAYGVNTSSLASV